ncbi:MAG: S-formylglutathione hydrolase [Pseudomonadota bacterium]|jgi:S-formylglutathione hydrolase
MSAFELLSRHACFGGEQHFYRHASMATGTPMRFALYLPPQALAGAKVPLVMYLAGLTCTEETATIKAGAQQHAARLGLALLMPDTSPRGTDIFGQDHHWDFGVAASFYLDATEAPWRAAWQMESYLLDELLPLVEAHQPVDAARVGIMGHSMGGHGALTLALRHPGRFQSLSALAPICHPVECPWGRKAFAGYLGDDASTWAAHDATLLMQAQTTAPYPAGILVDQGLDDQFLATQLMPEAFEAACAQVGQALTLRRHPGYDHGYYFIQTVMADHLAHHATRLR